MKKWLSLVLVIAMMATLIAGCSNGGSADSSAPAGESSAAGGAKQTLLYYCGQIGDYGFGDMGNAVTDEVSAKYNLEKTLVEYGTDSSVAVNSYLDAIESKHYDFVVSTSWYLTDAILENADKYPDTTFIIYDTAPSAVFDKPNVYGIYFGQNEGGFLVAVYSALMSKTNVIGCALRSDTPILNDFGTGWLAGYKYAVQTLGKTELEMKMAYMGEAQMSATYETCKVMYDQDKIDYLWSVAGNLIQGACQAAEDKGGLAKGYAVIGVDMDQWAFFQKKNPTQVGINNIVTSMLKNIEICVARVFDSIFGDKSIKAGNSFYGVAVGGTGLAYNENWEKNTPKEIQDQVKGIEAKIVSGEIKVETYFGFKTHEDFLKFRQECEDLVK